MKVSKDFRIEEFVPPEIFNVYGTSSTWFVQPQLVVLAQFIRDYFEATMTINTWYRGGVFKERGYRIPASTTGSKYSQHKRGAAIDFTIKGLSADEVRRTILDNQQVFLAQGLTAIEDEEFSPTWVHADIRYIHPHPTKILIVRPAQMLINSEDYSPQMDEYFTFENGELIPKIFPAEEN